MRLERAGQAAVLLLAALGVSALAFRDFAVESALLVVFMAFAAEAVWVRLATRRPEAKFAFSREESGFGAEKVILYPGAESDEKMVLTKKVGGRAEFQSRVNFLNIEPSVIRGSGRFAVHFHFSTEYAGDYSGDEVGVRVTGPLGMFSSQTGVPFAQRYVVYPRVLQVAAATVKLLGRAELGETPIDMPGVGSEYYEMRQYHPGDDYRNVNWKASAREGELIVVEHMREVGSSFLLVLDARGGGFQDTDNLASTFLSVANSLGAAGVSFGIIVHDGSRVIDASSQADPRASLALALKEAVAVTKLESSPELLELVPVGISSKLAAGARLDEQFALSQISELRRAELRAVLEHSDPWATTARYVRETQTRSVVYVSGLFGDVQPLIELAWESRHYRDADFSVANPCDEGEKHSAYQKAAKALSTAGIAYYRGSPIDLARKILTA